MIISDLIATRRILLGISQGLLASRAKVSVPTVQKIEAGQGNPSLDTLEALLHPLGFGIHFMPRDAQWDYLIRCGLPITGGRKITDPPLKDRFLEELRIALVNLKKSESDAEAGRKRDALDALLWALQTHYPSVYKQLKVGGAKPIHAFSTPNQGRLIKLKRIALAGLSRFL